MGGKSSKKKAEEPVPAGPLDLLVEGGKVYLTSKASSKLLQVHEGNIDVSAAKNSFSWIANSCMR